MSTPAQRDLDAPTQSVEQQSPLDRFRAAYDFPLDPFQVRACSSVADGRGVLVAAPTGAGKTVVGEFAVFLALERGRKCFYTTPIKALSNQKYHDLVARHGPENVGLLTGDISINSEAPVVVMTTEVLRNMLYAGSTTLGRLGYVVMDEVHYLADRFRGAVWEEVIINLADDVAVVSLSATVSNAEEFGEWLATVRGDTDVIVEEHRPVPLWQHVMTSRRLYDLFVDDSHEQVNPDLVRRFRDRPGQRRGRRPQRGAPNRGDRGARVGTHHTPDRITVLERLDAEDLLPAITFVFSRTGCDAAVTECVRAGIRLTHDDELPEIRQVVAERCADIPPEDLEVLGYREFVDGLERGVAAHHAGMLPAFKETVETLFVRGLVRAVFATETLALGINMPARTVVLERLVKWNGETHADITPGEYTQLTGRAGRRGIDVEGHAVVLWQPDLDPMAVAGLASTRTYPLRSSFRPSYNMTVNLVDSMGREDARELLESSFAQFQADRGVVGMARRLHEQSEAMTGYAEAMTCNLGDFGEYHRIRQAISEREKKLSRESTARRRDAAIDSLQRLRTGDIIRVPAGKFAGLAVVVEPDHSTPARGSNGPRPSVVTGRRQLRRLALTDFPVPVEPLDRMRVPKSFNPRVPSARRDLISAMHERVAPDAGGGRPPRPEPAANDDPELTRLRKQLRAHPCHGCDEREQHMRWAERWEKLRRDNEQLRRRMDRRTGTIARQFDRVCGVLDDLEYLDGDQVTADGRRLMRLYGELDLVAAEALRRSLWDGLDPTELAACVSALTFETRRPDDASPPPLPVGPVQDTLRAMARLWGELEEIESAHQVDFLREPDSGFALAAWRWARGDQLHTVLEESGMPAGDFVRNVRQLVDLLDQVALAADETTVRKSAREAVRSLRRGVVDYEFA